MRLKLFASIIALGIGTQIATAQRFPDANTTAVNDFADMLPGDAETRITEILDTLEQDTGADATIVTLSSVRFYAQDMSVADYATALFNEWGIGDVEDGNGVLLIVFRDDKELRLEIGEGFDNAAQTRAKDVVDDDIIPLFAQGDMVGGIEAGANGIADHIVRNNRVSASNTADTGDAKDSNILWYILGGIGAFIAGIFGLNRRAAAKLAATPCPACGVAGQLEKSRVVLEEATEDQEGRGENRTTCGACGHIERESYTINRVKIEKDEFQGGKSKGDGASGKW